jgi:class 3 adenylate cyclase/tetratricopeptide (TPR) repeat protein
MRCPACSSDNVDGQKFCGQCGSPLARVCPACSAAVSAAQKFCGECGSVLSAAVLAAPVVPAQAGPVAERRTVSVLFADLVGFTTMSESRDPEEVRELLSRYFDVANTTVARYGGEVEKFIGDAVMAVWGVPTAHEDDAERAVRAGLDLVEAVAALGTDVGLADLRLRAGVVTGEVAVTLGATGQGMVAGDAVNTASRVQSLAPAGTVWVDQATRQATVAAIAYADAGIHELKGKSSSVQLFEARRVVAGVRGTQRVDGLEAPFTGRDREFRLVKEMFHACAEERRARLVSVVGVPGIGKSRLAWEFFKYLDGVATLAYWHVGRCLSYGEGVAYWALAEVVRMRLRIAESDPADVARERLADGLAEYVPDADDRGWLEPRLGILLGLGEGATFARDELFAAWRLFFERLTATAPVVIVIEDLQWADDSLLDFLDYLLDWSANSPLYVLTMARPEVEERRPGWGGGRRNATSLYLEPLSDVAMRTLVAGLVDGLPEPVTDLLVARAEGVPLYAVETVRMLIDRDVVVPREGRYVLADPAASLADLDVPASLQALVAARIDGLSAEERRVLSDAAVLGQSFTREGLEAVLAATGSSVDLDAALAALVRKEILGLQADPRSPERGQYRFLQAVLRQVPYDTMSRRDRKVRHLAVAAHLADSDELSAVLASHYLDAADAVPTDADAAGLRDKAREYLVRAADRAASLGAPMEAMRYYERALALAEDQRLVAHLSERVGNMLSTAGDPAAALPYLARAHEMYEGWGELAALARVAAAEGDAMWLAGRQEDGIALMEPVFAACESLGADRNLARLAGVLGRCHVFVPHNEEAVRWCERAATLAEHTGSWSDLVYALNYRSVALMNLARPQEARGLLALCIELIRRHVDEARFVAPYNNIAILEFYRAPRSGLEMAREGLELARRCGDRGMELYQGEKTMTGLMLLGDWDAAEELGHELLSTPLGSSRGAEVVKAPLRYIRYYRGDVEGVRALTVRDHTFEHDMAPMFADARAMELLAEGQPADAVQASKEAFDLGFGSLGPEDMGYTVARPIGVALDAGDVDGAEQMLVRLEAWPAGARATFVDAQIARLRSRVTAARGSDEGVVEGFQTAERLFAELGMPFYLAETRLDHATWAAGAGRTDEARALVEQAVPAFERLRALPYLRRASELSGVSVYQ